MRIKKDLLASVSVLDESFESMLGTWFFTTSIRPRFGDRIEEKSDESLSELAAHKNVNKRRDGRVRVGDQMSQPLYLRPPCGYLVQVLVHERHALQWRPAYEKAGRNPHERDQFLAQNKNKRVSKSKFEIKTWVVMTFCVGFEYLLFGRLLVGSIFVVVVVTSVNRQLNSGGNVVVVHASCPLFGQRQQVGHAHGGKGHQKQERDKQGAIEALVGPRDARAAIVRVGDEQDGPAAVVAERLHKVRPVSLRVPAIGEARHGHARAHEPNQADPAQCARRLSSGRPRRHGRHPTRRIEGGSDLSDGD